MDRVSDNSDLRQIAIEEATREIGAPVRNISPRREVVIVGREVFTPSESITAIVTHCGRLKELSNVDTLYELMVQEAQRRQAEGLMTEETRFIWAEVAHNIAQSQKDQTNPKTHLIVLQSLTSVAHMLDEMASDGPRKRFELDRGETTLSQFPGKVFKVRSVCPVSGQIGVWVSTYAQVRQRLASKP